MVRIIKSAGEWQRFRKSQYNREEMIGFVPTMGALHAGHESLIKKSVEQNDLTVVSIFINPTQFNDPNDLFLYPKTYDDDLALLEKSGADFLFYPGYDEIYEDGYSYRVTENNFSRQLCGGFRPGHFDGVLTVILKLLNIISPRRAYFGEKDYQQIILIGQMCKAFFIDVDIIPCPTVRESDGLAISSRNRFLTGEERKRASDFPKILTSSSDPAAACKELESLGFKIDYITDLDGRRFGAVHIGNVRLIDNVQI